MTSFLYNKAISAYALLLGQYHRHSTTTIAVATISTASLFTLVPVAYRDYKLFMSYGPGGVPYNALGWLLVTVVFRPMTSEMFSTNVYDGQADKRSWLPDILSNRNWERPIVGPHAAPQRQLTQVPGKEMQEVSCFSAYLDLFIPR
jgi:hypothetical protein